VQRRHDRGEALLRVLPHAGPFLFTEMARSIIRKAAGWEANAMTTSRRQFMHLAAGAAGPPDFLRLSVDE
jgi:hypothetical protein